MIDTLVHLFILVLILGLVFWLAEYIVSALPVSEPFRWVLKVIPAVIVLVVVLEYLLPLAKV